MRETMLVNNILLETMTYVVITVSSIQKDWMRNRPH
jgi:hypothetical protein